MIDLHMHSRYSEDGELIPAEVAERCRRRGITAMSTTDHSCARASAEARTQAEARGMAAVRGLGRHQREMLRFWTGGAAEG